MRIPVATAHGKEWFEGETEIPVNGPYTQRAWRFTDQYTQTDYTPACDKAHKELKAIDCFMAVFPRKQLNDMVERTNVALVASRKAKTTIGEMLKWFGTTVLITCFEFGN